MLRFLESADTKGGLAWACPQALTCCAVQVWGVISQQRQEGTGGLARLHSALISTGALPARRCAAKSPAEHSAPPVVNLKLCRGLPAFAHALTALQLGTPSPPICLLDVPVMAACCLQHTSHAARLHTAYLTARPPTPGARFTSASPPQ